MVDATSVTRLEEDVGADAAAGMIDRFIALLPGRIERLRRAVAAGEWAELRDAALSLSCSATMLGAGRLAALCDRCRAEATVPAELEQVAVATGNALATVQLSLGAAG